MAITLGVQQGGDGGSLDMRTSSDDNSEVSNSQATITASLPQHLLQSQSFLEHRGQNINCNDVRHPLRPCGACPSCGGGCGDDACVDCPTGCCGVCVRYYTMCEVQRHNTEQSAWLVAGDDIYDVTELLRKNVHPGGNQSILRKAGGVKDCTADLMFHSKAGRNQWRAYHVGKITKCPSQNGIPVADKEWWRFWG